MIFLKILFRLFKPQFLKLAAMPHNELEPQSRFANDRFKFAFYDDAGLAYYEMVDPNDTPIARKLFTANAFIKFQNAISDSDITTSLEAIKKAFHTQDAKGKTRPDVFRIAYICERLLTRKDKHINKDLLAEYAACYFIREDEAIGLVNEEILKDKVIYFSKEAEKIETMFYQHGFDSLFPYLKDLDVLLNDVFDWTMIQASSYTTELNAYLENGTK